MGKKLLEKVKEALLSVLPILVIVLALHFTIAPLSGSVLALFAVGSVFLVLGMSLFTLGSPWAKR